MPETLSRIKRLDALRRGKKYSGDLVDDNGISHSDHDGADEGEDVDVVIMFLLCEAAQAPTPMMSTPVSTHDKTVTSTNTDTSSSTSPTPTLTATSNHNLTYNQTHHQNQNHDILSGQQAYARLATTLFNASIQPPLLPPPSPSPWPSLSSSPSNLSQIPILPFPSPANFESTIRAYATNFSVRADNHDSHNDHDDASGAGAASAIATPTARGHEAGKSQSRTSSRYENKQLAQAGSRVRARKGMQPSALPSPSPSVLACASARRQLESQNAVYTRQHQHQHQHQHPHPHPHRQRQQQQQIRRQSQRQRERQLQLLSLCSTAAPLPEATTEAIARVFSSFRELADAALSLGDNEDGERTKIAARKFDRLRLTLKNYRGGGGGRSGPYEEVITGVIEFWQEEQVTDLTYQA